MWTVVRNKRIRISLIRYTELELFVGILVGMTVAYWRITQEGELWLKKICNLS